MEGYGGQPTSSLFLDSVCHVGTMLYLGCSVTIEIFSGSWELVEIDQHRVFTALRSYGLHGRQLECT